MKRFFAMLAALPVVAAGGVAGAGAWVAPGAAATASRVLVARRQ